MAKRTHQSAASKGKKSSRAGRKGRKAAPAATRRGNKGGPRAQPRVYETAPEHGKLPSLEGVAAARELFWHNVVREMLTSLSVMQMQGHAPELFDGRIGVLTHGGERIPIGSVIPMFACSIAGPGEDRHVSMAVECTVFRIQTPAGEVFTLPVHEIRAISSLTEELVKQLEQESLNRMRPDSAAPGPFGFAAFLPRREEEEQGAEDGDGDGDGGGEDAAPWNWRGAI